MTSIRRQLLASLLGALLFSTFVLAIVTYQVAKKEVDELFDSNLEEVATAMQLHRPLPDRRGEVITPLPWRAFMDSEDEFVIQAWDKKGRLEYTSHPDVGIPLQGTEALSTVAFEHQVWRVYRSDSQGGITQVSQIYNHREVAVEEVVVWILLVQIMFFCLFGTIIWFAVGRSMQPLARVSDSISRRGPNALEPIGIENIPTEIQPLASALNSLLQRLKHAMDVQRSFVADAAHELRTPLTAVNLQLSLLERATNMEERRTATSTLKEGMNRAIHLVQQLLLLARLEPQGNDAPRLPVNLRELVKSSIAQFIPIADARGTDLGINETVDASIEGDAEALRVLLNNIIDNAIRHTPVGGNVDVSLRASGRVWLLEVSDSGKGIAQADRERVMRRFYRGSNSSGEGTGLGLSIVQAIAERHGATITLGESTAGGLKVSVAFPR